MQRIAQVRIVHVSDIHFGDHHICAPPDVSGSHAGVPPIEDLLARDLADVCWAESLWANSERAPLLLAVTGDLTQRAAPAEFERAHDFLTKLTACRLLDTQIQRRDLFLIPGNHDVLYKERNAGTRFQPYSAFYNRIFDGIRSPIQPHNAVQFTQIHARPDANVVIAEINSCLYVEADTEDQSRGQVDLQAIAALRVQLEHHAAISVGAIKIALVHHHPVLIPSLVEPGRGYDAVLNAGSLLRLLREYGYQLVLHGHKHHPQVFSFDPESAWSTAEQFPQTIVAGGSLGSNELPPGARSGNTYNVITVKWDAEAGHGRIQIITRGLKRVGDDGPSDPTPVQISPQPLG